MAGGNAVKILQRMLHDFDQDCAIDGCLGPQFFVAANPRRKTPKANLWMLMRLPGGNIISGWQTGGPNRANTPATGQGGLDSPRRVIHGRKVLDEQYRVPSECVTMGLINKLLSNLFVGKNIVK